MFTLIEHLFQSASSVTLVEPLKHMLLSPQHKSCITNDAMVETFASALRLQASRAESPLRDEQESKMSIVFSCINVVYIFTTNFSHASSYTVSI